MVKVIYSNLHQAHIFFVYMFECCNCMRPFALNTLKMSTAPGIASFDTSQNTCRTASFNRSTSGVPGTLVNSTGRQRCWNCTRTFTAVGVFSITAKKRRARGSKTARRMYGCAIYSARCRGQCPHPWVT